MGIVVFFFEIPIVGIVLALTLLLGIDVGWLCRYLGSMVAVGGLVSIPVLLLIGKPWSRSPNIKWGEVLFLTFFFIAFIVYPGWEVYKVGIGMGDKVLMELLLGR